MLREIGSEEKADDEKDYEDHEVFEEVWEKCVWVMSNEDLAKIIQTVVGSNDLEEVYCMNDNDLDEVIRRIVHRSNDEGSPIMVDQLRCKGEK